MHGIAGAGAWDLSATKFLLERGGRKVADVREHAADSQARVRPFAGDIMATAEIRVALHAGARDGVERDRHGRLAQAGGEDRNSADLCLVVSAPDKSLHAAHRAADDGMELRDTEMTDH